MLAKASVPLFQYPARRIALIKPSALGDIIHSLPVLSALRQRYPDAYIAWVVNRSYAELLQGHPDLDAVLAFDRGASKSGLLQAVANYGRFFANFRQQAFDLVIDLQGLLRSGLMTACSGARRRVGLGSAREGARAFYTDVITVADFHAVHAVDRYWLVAEAFGMGNLPKSFRVPLPEAAGRWAAALLRDCPRPWIAMGVGARWHTKRWPPEQFADLARRAQKYAGGTVLFVGGRDETPLARAVADHLSGQTRDLTGENDASPASCSVGFGGCHDCQRHGPFTFGGSARPAGGRPLYLHEGASQRTVRRCRQRCRNTRLVSGELSQALWPAGVHGGIDPGAVMAHSRRDPSDMEEQLPFRLILASGSPARRDLLARAGYRFEVLPANIDEPSGEEFHDVRSLVEHTAWLKAAAVAPRIDDGIILAADTVGWLHGQVIGKPADESDARRILRMLAGTEHELWTGACLWRRPDDIQLAFQDVSRVAMAPLTEAELDAYLSTRTWQGCSGAYAIEEKDDPYVHVVEGSTSNVIGLPMETLSRVLNRLAVSWALKTEDARPH
jgi:MAF protein